MQSGLVWAAMGRTFRGQAQTQGTRLISWGRGSRGRHCGCGRVGTETDANGRHILGATYLWGAGVHIKRALNGIAEKARLKVKTSAQWSKGRGQGRELTTEGTSGVTEMLRILTVVTVP